jgi:hypothetical protein
MAELPHLILPRAEINQERRKRPGFGRPTQRDTTVQATRVRQAVDEAIQTHARLRASVINPDLILRVRTSHFVPEEEWIRAGLTVLGQESDDCIILFASDAELHDFRSRLEAYSEPIPEGQKYPQFNALISSIDEFSSLQPEDRIGAGLRNEGYRQVESFAEGRQFELDVELWEVGTQAERANQAHILARDVQLRNGEVTDRYMGRSFSAIRVRGNGDLFQWLLTIPSLRHTVYIGESAADH